MRRVISVTMFAMLVLFVLAISVDVRGQSQADLSRKLELLKAYPEVIVVNGKISTMDASNRDVQAIAVKNNRIIALGTNDEIRFLGGPHTEVLDAKGRRVLPGIIDSHTHPHLWGITHWAEAEGDFAAKKYNDPQLQIISVTGKDETEIVRNVERVVVQRAKDLGPGKWIWIHLFAGSNPRESAEITSSLIPRIPVPGVPTPPTPITRAWLDAIAPGNPVIVASAAIAGGGNNSVHNSRAKEEMLKILGVEVDGLGSWAPLFWDILMRGRTEEGMDFLKRELMTCLAAQGITAFGNHYYGTPSIMKIYRLLYEQGELPVRYAWWLGGPRGFPAKVYDDKGPTSTNYSYDPISLAASSLGDFRGIGNDYIWNAGVAFEIWNQGIGCTTAERLDPAKPLPDPTSSDRDCADAPKDYENDPAAQLYRNAQAALEAGLRIGYMHGTDDGSFDALFHMTDQAIAKGKLTLEQVKAMRITTEHDLRIRPDQIPKIAKYGIRINMTGRPNAANFFKDHGEQYLDWLLPMKSLVDADAHPMFNTDAHVHDDPFQFIPYDRVGPKIWDFLAFYLTRTMPAHKWVPASPRQAIDRVSLMKIATIWNAEGMLNEKNIGSLEVGKLADFIVIDKDFFTIPEDQIHSIKTLLTSVGGKTVFKDPTY